MKKTKLALIIHEFYPVLCGGTVFAEKIGMELLKMGYEVEILTAGIGKNFPRCEYLHGVKVIHFNTMRKTTHDASFLEHVCFFVIGAPKIFRYLLRNRPDIMFSIFAIPTGLIATFISKILRIPNIVFVDAADLPGIESAMQTIAKYLVIPFKLATNYAAGVTILEGLEDVAEKYVSNEQRIVIPNGTTIPEQTATPGRNESPLVFLSIGRLVLRKGFLDTILALAIVKKKRSDFLFNIVGYGTKEEEIARLLQDNALEANIKMLGRVEYDKLSEYYLDSDVYLFYGAREGSSLAMIEAASYGLPVIASDFPGNRAFVEHGQSGLLVEHRNPEKLAGAILNVLENRNQLPAWGIRSREIANCYSWSKIAERYDTFFRKVAPKAFL
ncbi:MAG: glycosyltransferase family 4 protein [Deltaproteobacteria bacterium]|nr:glycosyltransferase family 4 protein [Deltaproteobacteria bacterium]